MTKATVKWFNTTKGYGFVVPSEGGQDAYLHISILKQAGYEFLPEGTDVDCDLTEGRKGLQVELIKEVLKMGIGTVTESSEPSDEVQGTVKWFNSTKGFGFVTPDDGGKDVFVHVSALQRSGIVGLEPDQRVKLMVLTGRKGPQADAVEVLRV